ncbi:MAG: DUF4230 domain-containing protein [Erysipelotrichaceae bacterium]|nr:DUF4230 domain-containing protein [Erysipelotrichaceae bacterium]
MEENKKVELSEENKELAKAIAKEVNKFSWKDISVKDILTIAILAVLLFGGFTIYNNIQNQFTNLKEGLSSLVSFDDPADDHDKVLDNNGFLGYTAADFEEAILGDASQKKEIVVYTQEVSDVATLTQTGLFNWSALTKSQVITYKGSADYYVDLSNFSKSNIRYDEESKIVTMTIPHVLRKDININENDIAFSDPDKGLLAFGDIKITPEQMTEIQKEVRIKMEEKLSDPVISETADRFAKLTVWEIYSPVIKGIGKDVSLEIVFID